MLLQIRHLSTYPHGAEGSFAAYVRVCARYYCFDFREQISSHFDGGDISESAKGQANNVLVWVVQITKGISICIPARWHGSLLLERVCDKCQDLLVLIQQQHSPQIAQSLVRKARGCQELQTFDLSKMCPLAQGEEIEEFGDIVSPADV